MLINSIMPLKLKLITRISVTVVYNTKLANNNVNDTYNFTEKHTTDMYDTKLQYLFEVTSETDASWTRNSGTYLKSSVLRVRWFLKTCTSHIKNFVIYVHFLEITSSISYVVRAHLASLLCAQRKNPMKEHEAHRRNPMREPEAHQRNPMREPEALRRNPTREHETLRKNPTGEHEALRKNPKREHETRASLLLRWLLHSALSESRCWSRVRCRCRHRLPASQTNTRGVSESGVRGAFQTQKIFVIYSYIFFVKFTKCASQINF